MAATPSFAQAGLDSRNSIGLLPAGGSAQTRKRRRCEWLRTAALPHFNDGAGRSSALSHVPLCGAGECRLARDQGQRDWMIGASRPFEVAVDLPPIARHVGAGLALVMVRWRWDDAEVTRSRQLTVLFEAVLVAVGAHLLVVLESLPAVLVLTAAMVLVVGAGSGALADNGFPVAGLRPSTRRDLTAHVVETMS